MHQTFYIDIDEEITSIVERLRHSKSEEVVLVVPKRALLIQSIVNLRLLKKEADSMGISLSIVTQDNLGKILVEKAGIFYQDKLEETESIGLGTSENKIGESYFDNHEYSKIGENFSNQETGKMNKIGSDSYFGGNTVSPTESPRDKKDDSRSVSQNQLVEQTGGEKILNKELVSGIGEDIKARKMSGGIDSTMPAYSNYPSQQNNPRPLYGDKKNSYYSVSTSNVSQNLIHPNERIKNDANTYTGSSGDRKIDNFFQHNNYSNPVIEDKSGLRDANVSKKVFGVFWIFGLILVLLILGAAAYFILPKADVIITAKGNLKSQEAEIKSDAKFETVDYENEIVPAKTISTTIEVSENVASSGGSASSSKKAKGTITIYNEFSSASQSLVATTRFETEDGKIFRLEKGITVPGTTKVDGETKAGAIEADVVADEAGEAYNIGPSKFTIPGFKDSGNGKYDKIYAKSTKSMSGGGNADNSSEGANRKITEADVSGAKSKILSKLQEEAKNKIREAAGGEMVVLDDAINMNEAAYSLSNSVGEAVDKFEIKGQMKVDALAFKESDLKDILGRIAAKSGNGKASLEGSSIAISYGKANVDFKAETMTIKIVGTINNGTDIDRESLKKEILGKTNEELESYLSAYPDIEKVDVIYWPPFMNSKVPLYEKRVSVMVEVE